VISSKDLELYETVAVSESGTVVLATWAGAYYAFSVHNFPEPQLCQLFSIFDLVAFN